MWSATIWPITPGTAVWRRWSASPTASWTFAGCLGGCTCSPRCSAFRASPARVRLRSCRWRTHWPTASAVRRWRPGSLAGGPGARGGTATGGLLAVAGGRCGPHPPPAGSRYPCGLLAPGLGSRPRLPTNARPGGARSVRTLVRHRAQLPGPTVTVAVLAALSTALSRLLGGPVDSLGAEVPMAKPGVPHAYNHFGNVTVGLYPELAAMLGSSGSRPTWPMAAPPLRASGYALGRPRLRRGTRGAVALGRLACSTPMPGRRRSPATPWCPAFTVEPPI